MIEPLIPSDEKERLAALRQLRILDTPDEERFDRITRIARDLFQVPTALISLVDAHRQWFKSRTCLDAHETSRAVSFCGHAILGTDAFVVENALADPRFADNPLVTGPPGVHFYAGMPLRSVTGKALGTLCLIDDKPRRFAAADVARLRDLAAWAERELNLFVEIESAITEMRETFVRLVSHELGTPVTSIVGALELLRSDSVDALSRIAVDGARKLNRIVDDIVEISELDAGQQGLTPSPVELRLFVEAVVDHYATAAGQVGVDITVDAPSGMIVQADPKQLGRILRNLLDNALRFSPHDSSIAIAVTDSNPGMVRISITDQGPGISAEHLPRLFQPFVQIAASDSLSYDGFGVSLVICRRLATAMGGYLGYEAADSGGSRFFLDLPG